MEGVLMQYGRNHLVKGWIVGGMLLCVFNSLLNGDEFSPILTFFYVYLLETSILEREPFKKFLYLEL